jgi:hypothetical protein
MARSSTGADLTCRGGARGCHITQVRTGQPGTPPVHTLFLFPEHQTAHCHSQTNEFELDVVGSDYHALFVLQGGANTSSSLSEMR